MRDKKIKRTHKWFWNYDYDKQEKYYSDMHAKGWALMTQNSNGVAATVRQIFEKCEPANVVYKIGYNAVVTDRDSYIQMFSDYGWEYCGIINDFYYFRKNADGVSPEELDIFSDDESRLDMAKKVLKTKLPILLILTVLVLIPQTIRLINEPKTSWLNWALLGLYGLCWVMYLWAFLRSWLGYRRLKARFGADEKI